MIKIFKKFEKKFKGFHKTKKINPHHHWVILIKIFLLASFLLILLGFYILYKIRNEQIFQVVPEKENTPSLIKEELLEDFRESLRSKEIKSIQINEGEIIFVDPS